jgi:hypothetical protein
MSLTKDLFILSHALQFDPDMIVWPLTLESFPSDKQLITPLLQNNPKTVQALIDRYDLNLDRNDSNFVNFSIWDQTVLGARRSLADLIRLQLFGVMWAATGIDQDIPENYKPPIEDLSEDNTFHDLQPPHLSDQGENSDIRYNFFYPRWAYDDYRILMSEYSRANHWHYLDLWNAIPETEFTNSAVHLSAKGTQQLADLVSSAILEILNQN